LPGLVPSTPSVGSLQNPLAGKAGQKKDLGIDPIFVTESTFKFVVFHHKSCPIHLRCFRRIHKILFLNKKIAENWNEILQNNRKIFESTFALTFYVFHVYDHGALITLEIQSLLQISVLFIF